MCHLNLIRNKIYLKWKKHNLIQKAKGKIEAAVAVVPVQIKWFVLENLKTMLRANARIKKKIKRTGRATKDKESQAVQVIAVMSRNY